MMKTVLACLLLFVPTIAGAQSDEVLIEEAPLPLPDYHKAAATVSVQDERGGRRVLRERGRRRFGVLPMVQRRGSWSSASTTAQVRCCRSSDGISRRGTRRGRRWTR